VVAVVKIPLLVLALAAYAFVLWMALWASGKISDRQRARKERRAAVWILYRAHAHLRQGCYTTTSELVPALQAMTMLLEGATLITLEGKL
jgi:hypothetical protein